MTLPTTTTVNGCEDDSDMFGPPRSSPPIGYHHHRSRVPMISPKLRQREERKRILQLCAHKLERIKDSEMNLRRSVCINNTYCRLTDELRREKQSRYLANLPRSEVKPESARDNIFNPYSSCGIDNSNHQPSNKFACNEIANNNASPNNNNNALNLSRDHDAAERNRSSDEELLLSGDENNLNCNNNNNKLHSSTTHVDIANSSSHSNCAATTSTTSTSSGAAFTSHTTAIHTTANVASTIHSTTTHTTHFTATASSSCHAINTTTVANSSLTSSLSSSISSSSVVVSTTSTTHSRKRPICSSNLDNDLEILDRELSEINAPMPLIDPEITQGAEQLEKAISSRKRLRSEDESDRLVREALSQFYIPQQRLISAIEDCPLDVVSVGGGMGVGVGLGLGMGVSVGMGMGPMSPSKRQKLSNGNGGNELELEFDLNQNQKDFEVIMDALRLGTPSPTPSVGSDSCGQAAMMSESASVFHNLVVTSLET
ncbi:PREDICTED: homeobox protein 13 [Rhagoletis zephyria]|uniref:homeobox protein 13 n=1 Tax=Rhagoletis zephyria TaxID=28612 RepID=UPI0008113347|nr:PREDICTED: homeobox protein 13 [Rhagoletis zephyria]XP_017475019.1 PREDICTED: homeobox protein 13 [Rhagoletis zephyria]